MTYFMQNSIYWSSFLHIFVLSPRMDQNGTHMCSEKKKNVGKKMPSTSKNLAMYKNFVLICGYRDAFIALVERKDTVITSI